MTDFRASKNPNAAAKAAADYLYQRITDCISEKGQCHVVLPGGSTPALCLELLAQKPLSWKNIHWYPGDERCLPSGHAERNDTMMAEKLFSHLPPSITHIAENFHRIPAELGPQQGAEVYDELLGNISGLDIVVLGMGEDGHTASLFPDNPALDNPHNAVPVFNAPKPPSERISIGLQALKMATERIVIATGEGKKAALMQVRQGRPLPVNLIKPDIFFVDQAAI